ncbi:MAG: MinD/ParA family protein [Lachnospiraceae bacterium]|uniref:MinD/ParA family protein n=1 Tax=Candidatus Weimeria bifida TaxID=2599074 RepID=A0A6N7J044_9FIRM|nr:MinD/ParA family protein [Candidatus Weimeria bifida]RRF96317.1 MAG: MinD/ParA family protein [Lachnospiraceae bacterium]
MDQAEGLRNVIKSKNQNNVASARVITITSGKGGVGKSNLAVNLAVQFRKMGKKVIIFDADFGLANVEVMFNTIPKNNLSDVVFKGIPLTDVITEGPMDIGFISAGSGIISLNDLSEDQTHLLVRSITQLSGLCDVIIVDTGAGISNHVMDFVLASPEILLVATPEPSSITDSYSLLKALILNPAYNDKISSISLVANRLKNENEGETVYKKLDAVVNQFLNTQIDFAGGVPQDVNLEKAVRSQKIVSLEYPGSRSARAFEAIAKKLMDNGGHEKSRGFSIRTLFDSFMKK